MENLEKLKMHLVHIEGIVNHIKRKHLNPVIPEIITTSDGKKWFYDDKHHEWIEVTMSKEMRGKLVPLR